MKKSTITIIVLSVVICSLASALLIEKSTQRKLEATYIESVHMVGYWTGAKRVLEVRNIESLDSLFKIDSINFRNRFIKK